MNEVETIAFSLTKAGIKLYEFLLTDEIPRTKLYQVYVTKHKVTKWRNEEKREMIHTVSTPNDIHSSILVSSAMPSRCRGFPLR